MAPKQNPVTRSLKREAAAPVEPRVQPDGLAGDQAAPFRSALLVELSARYPYRPEMDGRRPPIDHTPDGEPVYPIPNPRRPSGSRGGSGAAGTAGQSEYARLEQLDFWQEVSDSLSSSRVTLYNFFRDHIQEMSTP